MLGVRKHSRPDLAHEGLNMPGNPYDYAIGIDCTQANPTNLGAIGGAVAMLEKNM